MASAAVVGMVALIMVIYVRTGARRRHVEALRNLWRRPILEYLEGGSLEPSPILTQAARDEPLIFLKQLISLGNFLDGENAASILRLMRATPLMLWMERVAAARHDYRFPEVARAVALFRIDSLRKPMISHLHSKRDVERIAAAYAVARLADPDDVFELSQSIREFTASRRDLAFLILSAFAKERPDKFVQFFKSRLSADDPVYLLAMEVAGGLDLRGAAPVIVEEIKAPASTASLNTALLAAGNMRLIEAHEAIHFHIRHDDEQVRGAAAWALGRLRHSIDATTLAAMLEDRSWTVRLNAAAALLALGAHGMEALRHAAEQSQDPFARDMAQRAITQQNLGVALA